MKTSLLLVLVTGLSLVLTAGSCLQGKHVVGSKNYISQEVKADHFNEIKLLGSANISYHQDTRSHVEIHGSDNIIPLVETYVDGNTLMIKFKKNVSIWKGKLEIKVFAPELNKLSINGSGNIKLINGIQTSKDIEFHINGSGNIQGEGLNCRRMAVSINGSGDVRLQQIESQECQAGISGSGNINLKGKAIQAKYAIAGSGNIQAADLEEENTDASISGSGNISCYASQKLVARVKGSGDIAYKGNPQEVDAPRKNIRQIKERQFEQIQSKSIKGLLHRAVAHLFS